MVDRFYFPEFSTSIWHSFRVMFKGSDTDHDNMRGTSNLVAVLDALVI